jgi:hypothetical protein
MVGVCMCLNDEEVSYDISSLLKELEMFIEDKNSNWFMLSRYQAMLLYGEVMSLTEDLEK